MQYRITQAMMGSYSARRHVAKLSLGARDSVPAMGREERLDNSPRGRVSVAIWCEIRHL